MMKKFFLLMAIALPLVFISCNDDEPAVSDGHEWVDLGLPSGTLWATCNVGADSPEEYGDYFAWGETAPKDEYFWYNYKWAHWEYDTINDHYYIIKEETWYKYFQENVTENGSVRGDRKTELDPEDDAASVNWGSRWRTPTLEQFQELLTRCDWQWVEKDTVNGFTVTGPNGKSIFLPTVGLYSSEILNAGKFAYYWSSTRCPSNLINLEHEYHAHAYILFFNSWKDQHIWYDARTVGHPVRAVRSRR
ncbi:MAG: hypothetical protein IJV05_09130 [Muribaculaceae bacterium]|nr:hypothetical protein [Muribaculaceae bacterium]